MKKFILLSYFFLIVTLLQAQQASFNTTNEIKYDTLTLDDVDFSNNTIKKVTNEEFAIENLYIPDSLAGYPVYYIASSAFSTSSGGKIREVKLKNIILPSSLKIIYSFAFIENEIESIEFPENIEIIDEYSFSHNKLKSISFKGASKLKWISTTAFVENPRSIFALPQQISDNVNYMYMWVVGESGERYTETSSDARSKYTSKRYYLLNKYNSTITNNTLTNCTVPKDEEDIYIPNEIDGKKILKIKNSSDTNYLLDKVEYLNQLYVEDGIQYIDGKLINYVFSLRLPVTLKRLESNVTKITILNTKLYFKDLEFLGYNNYESGFFFVDHEGYNWYTSMGDRIEPGYHTVQNMTEYYLERTKGYEITYMNAGNYNTYQNPRSYNPEDTPIALVDLPNNESIDLYFQGWYYDEGYTLKVDGNAIPKNANSDYTFYAKWVYNSKESGEGEDNEGEGSEGEGSEGEDNEGEGSEGEDNEGEDNEGEGSEGEGSDIINSIPSSTEFLIYPNPASAFIRIPEYDILSIIDLNGKVVLTETNGNQHLNVNTLPSGIYVIKLIKNQKVSHASFIKE
ncbi:T9SS type A sorting domain-containing protein [Flammeovirga aprica]|uniref:Leucine-rich repeat protein n=1 Tax=Flammeovirga aprica JL-4 TaxID=694437 RepID=A0A7X9P310_9BACT|nr:T9SS type A sorting domain-containing protein [Flammeovirga aprica]NME68405.1 leucine-rich repeat protein [Flammeovirga aprica JL-4]